MNFISPEAIIENARFKRDKAPDDFHTIPFKTLVADNFEQSMKKYLTNPTSSHYSSAYAEDIGLTVPNERGLPTQTSEKFPTLKGINTGGKEWNTTIGQYENKALEIPDNDCGDKFKELVKTADPKSEKGISYPAIKENFSISSMRTECVVGIVVIIILLITVYKLNMRVFKLKHKNKILRMRLRELNDSYAY